LHAAHRFGLLPLPSSWSSSGCISTSLPVIADMIDVDLALDLRVIFWDFVDLWKISG
jgi:hypothetical protein